MREHCPPTAPCMQPGCVWCFEVREARQIVQRRQAAQVRQLRAAAHRYIGVALASRSYATGVVVARQDAGRLVVEHTQVMPPRTRYAKIASYLAETARECAAVSNLHTVVDVTGVSRRVAATVTRPLPPRVWTVTLVGGDEDVPVLPRLEVVGALTLALERRGLVLTGHDALANALETYRDGAKDMRGPSDAGTWRAGQSDELPLALGLCAWAADEQRRYRVTVPWRS